jgi:electron-transferring-flavoprotein dehydrogenase
MTGVEQWFLPKIGVSSPPWTLHRSEPDHVYLKPADQCFRRSTTPSPMAG